MKFFGILEIENKTDILAFAAFLMSMLSILYTVNSFVSGSDVVLFAPSAIIVISVNYEKVNQNDSQSEPDNIDRYIAMIARFSYSNRGAVDYSSMITNEKINFEIGDKNIEQDWHAFVATKIQSGFFDLSADIEPVFRDFASPFVLKGGSTRSHETFFASRTVMCNNNDETCEADRNYVPLTVFLEKFQSLKEESGPNVIPFDVELVSRVVGEGPFRTTNFEKVTCRIMIRLQDIENIEEEDKRYFSRPCV